MLRRPRVPASQVLDRVLVLEMVRVTEAAAVAASKWIGRGDNDAADAAAVEAMREALNELPLGFTKIVFCCYGSVCNPFFAVAADFRHGEFRCFDETNPLSHDG
jgi:hypothetical protein